VYHRVYGRATGVSIAPFTQAQGPKPMSIERPAPDPRLEPQRKLISVLFADVTGSTRMIAALDPEDAWALLKPVLAAMQAAIHRFGGVVSKEAGDGIMAFFGAPAASDDHAELACRAALALQQEIAELKRADLRIRIGIHSGEVVLHQVRHDFSSVYDAAGGVVHIAQKIQSSAAPGTTLISGACHALLHGRFEASPFHGELTGFDRTFELFTLDGLRPVSRWEARAEVGLSPFVGRRNELSILSAAADAVLAGGSRSVMIVGEPGAGKSRLVHEFLAQGAFRDWRIWRCNAEATTKQIAWNVARRVLIAVAESDGRAIEFVRDRAVEFAAVRSDEERLALGSLLGIPFDNAAWAESTPEHRSRLMLDVFARAVIGACARARTPVALIIDDLQWVDLESLDALDNLGAPGDGASLLILATKRSADARSIFGDEALRVPLAALAPTDANLLLQTLLGEAPELERVKQSIVAHTGGVPLFVEEVVRQLVASRFAPESGGEQAPPNPLQQLGIPPTIQGLIASRIDRLDNGARALLQVASVLGNGASEADVLAVRDAAADVSGSSFAVLERAALLRAVSGPAGREIRFAHDLIREVAYSGMLRARRRELHRCALDRLIALDAAPGAAALYRHAEGAEDWEKVVGYARRAAAEAVEQSAYWNSLEYSDAAIKALDRLPKTEQNVQLEIDLRLEARLAFGATAQLKKLLSYAEHAQQRAQSIHDQKRMIAASMQKVLALTFVGTPDETLSAAEIMLTHARAQGVPQVEAVARYLVGQANYMAGHYREAANLMAAAFDGLPSSIGLARLGTTGTTSALIKVLQATSLASLGEFESAADCITSAADIAARTRRPYDEAALAYGSGYAALLQGRLGDAIAVVQPSLTMVKERDIVFFKPVLGNLLGQACIAAGRGEDGLQILQEAQRSAIDLGYVGARIGISLSLGAARMAIGDWRGAEEVVRPCLESARQQGYRGIHANAARYAAILSSKSGGASAAVERLFEEAIEVGTAIEARPSVALSQLALAEFRIASGDKTGAPPLLTAAAEAFAAMGMAHYAQRARRSMQALT
jgi:class 3 adenylate cyclase/tetratricopeptide (TPR) repeat protein